MIMSSIFSLQASEQLKQLAEDPKIQHFLNNTPTKMTMQDKLIHQPGCLRKVSWYSPATLFHHMGNSLT